MGISLIWLMHMGTHDQTKPLNQTVLDQMSLSNSARVQCKQNELLLWGVNSFTCLLYHFFTIYQRKMVIFPRI